MKAKTLFNPERGSTLPPMGYRLIEGFHLNCPISPGIAPDLTDDTIGGINQGIIIANYGHGSTQSFAQGDIVNTDEIPGLSNDQRLPAMVMMTCRDRYFAMPMARDF